MKPHSQQQRLSQDLKPLDCPQEKLLQLETCEGSNLNEQGKRELNENTGSVHQSPCLIPFDAQNTTYNPPSTHWEDIEVDNRSWGRMRELMRKFKALDHHKNSPRLENP